MRPRSRLQHTTFATIFFLTLSALPSMSQGQIPRPQESSAAEDGILAAAASSPEFNIPERQGLRAALARSGERAINSHSVGTPVGSPQPDLRQTHEVLRSAACGSQLIVLGRVLGSTSRRSHNEGTVITLYRFRVEALF